MRTFRWNVVLILAGLAGSSPAQSVPVLMNHQGRLMEGTNLVNDTVGLSLRLFTAPAGGTRLYEDSNDVAVVDGLYSVLLGENTTFGTLTNALAVTNTVYLETMVNGVALAPRERIAASAFALLAGGLATNIVVPANLRLASFAGTFWKLDGNAGTLTGTHFLGTTDAKPLDFVVNNTRALRLEPGSPAPSLAGGHATNSVAGAAGATIGGGGEAGAQQRVSSNFGTIGGGSGNRAAGVYATVAGGTGNVASNQYAAIGGGVQNTAGGQGAVVGGGFMNGATLDYTTIAGGQANSARGAWSTVGGGYGNAASNAYGTVAGGFDNSAGGLFSFAAGNRAKANHHGTFVFGDSNTAYVVSTNANSWTVRCTGGARFISAVDGGGNPSAGVILGRGEGAWASMSDRNAKENFSAVAPREVLDKVVALPVTTWNMKAQDPSIRHMGPMAQDFRAAFGLGTDERYIGAADADGVALAAIQGLYEIIREQRSELVALRAEIEALKGRDAARAASDRPTSDAGGRAAH